MDNAPTYSYIFLDLKITEYKTKYSPLAVSYLLILRKKLRDR